MGINSFDKDNPLHAKVSLVDNVYDRVGRITNVCLELKRIQNGSVSNQIIMIRNAETLTEKSELKQSLPAVTWGGLFNGRSQLIKSSGLACLDFDKVINLDLLNGELRNNKYILASWLSPSGTGVKALVRIPRVTSKEAYLEYYRAILFEFDHLNPDQSTKDLNRLCFTSYDPGIYVNELAETFIKRIDYKVSIKPPRFITNPPLFEGRIIQYLLTWWKKKYSFSRGTRNNDIYVLAFALSEYGVSMDTTLSLLLELQQPDFCAQEIESTIKSAYKRSIFNSKSF